MGVKTFDHLRDLVLDEDNTYAFLSVEDVGRMIDQLRDKRHSRIWFDPDVRLLNALYEAEQALEKVASYLVAEGMEIAQSAS